MADYKSNTGVTVKIATTLSDGKVVDGGEYKLYDGESAFVVWANAQKPKEDGTLYTTADYFAAIKGAKGDTGAQGPKGDTGAKGDTGPQGVKGETGAQGVKGDTGAKGERGEQGVSVVGVTSSTTRF